jgi:hypothetical protein
METKQTAVEWIEDNLLYPPKFDELIKIIDKAKQMEKEQIKEKLIDILEWMNKVAENNPMAFETDSNDIVEMYLNGYYNEK